MGVNKILKYFFLFFIIFTLVSGKKRKPKRKNKYDSPVIGIDLGTTYSCVSIFRNGQVEIIPNLDGERTTPSVVSWDKEGNILIGKGAKNNAVYFPFNTFYDVKRLIGRKYNEILKEDFDLLSYRIVNKNSRPYIQRKKNDGTIVNYSPEQISAFVLEYLKKSAEKYLGTDVKYAVITVPAYFNDAQRMATKAAGKVAGLEVIRIVNEPTAASMAYGLDKEHSHNVIVFDLGGGTFDVSLLSIALDRTTNSGVFSVVATSGDMHLGGEDFDLRIVNHFTKVWEKKTGLEISKDQKAFQRLKQAAEYAKIELSSKLETSIILEDLQNEIEFNEKLSRAKFEMLNNDLFKNTIKPVKQVLQDANMKRNQIQEIVLVGGSTRIPKVQALLSDFFNGRSLHSDINPDEAVAFGASMQAGILAGVMDSDFVLVDVNALSLGVETKGGVMSTIIPRNTPIPCKKSESYTTTHDNQEMIKIPVYEGERQIARQNRLLGEFELRGIPRAPRGVPQITITFQLNQNGILKCTAEETSTGAKQQIIIEKPALSDEEIERMKSEAEFHHSEDSDQIKRSLISQRFRDLVQYSRDQMKEKDVYSQWDKTQRKKISVNIQKANSWIIKFGDVKGYDKLKLQYNRFKDYIEGFINLGSQFEIDDIESYSKEPDFEVEEDLHFGDDEPQETKYENKEPKKEEKKEDIFINDVDVEEEGDDL